MTENKQCFPEKHLKKTKIHRTNDCEPVKSGSFSQNRLSVMTFISRRSAGFTLIEICMVLVLLGILAAVAVPKFFDVQDESRQKAAVAAIAEAQARINAAMGQKLVEGYSCADAVRAINKDLESPQGLIADRHGKYFGDYQLKFDDLSPAGLSQAVTVSYMGEPVAGGAQLGTLVAAQCSGLGNPDGVSSLGRLLEIQSTYRYIIASYLQTNSNKNDDQEFAKNYVEQEIIPQMAGLGEVGYWRLVKGGTGPDAAANLFITNAAIRDMNEYKPVPFIQVRQKRNGDVEYYVGMVGAGPVSAKVNGTQETRGGLMISDDANARIWQAGSGSLNGYGGDANAGYYINKEGDTVTNTRPAPFTNYQDALSAYQTLVESYKNRSNSLSSE
ncbi:MAG: Tfp pilus assembly protein FimT/FimU [Sutterella sp.]